MKVSVLMSTYNGESYLEEQIESVLNQRDVDVSLLVRDDGSSDGTIGILDKYHKKGLLRYYQGDNVKPALSFFDLISSAARCEYYALCDQDDYWLETKLSNALSKLQNCPENRPSLYFSKAQVVDSKLNIIDGISYPNGAYDLGKALLRNNATGCTMVFNNELSELIKKYTPKELLMHDHWIYLLCICLDGSIVYDDKSYVLYRQHGKNVCGASGNLLTKIKRSGFGDKNETRKNIAMQILSNYWEYIPEENRQLVSKVANYQNSLKDKLALINEKRIKSHNLISDTSVFINIILNKL